MLEAWSPAVLGWLSCTSFFRCSRASTVCPRSTPRVVRSQACRPVAHSSMKPLLVGRRSSKVVEARSSTLETVRSSCHWRIASQGPNLRTAFAHPCHWHVASHDPYLRSASVLHVTGASHRRVLTFAQLLRLHVAGTSCRKILIFGLRAPMSLAHRVARSFRIPVAGTSRRKILIFARRLCFSVTGASHRSSREL